ncbi:glutathione S-transferase family protein [Agrobacterium fabrum]|uniref:glutathione S-transferase family protein n=1 Tax=Agrobacterium fabrum TaxID=1176649 RepID=UPI0015749AB8|nr:glutathione S-transferase family protein [Agrobacterium fabrum]WCK80177.1 glutathione S-transferase family protein [Agrobacterium fabrum]
MTKITIWGFSGSTYVRTIRMLLAEKGVTDYVQIPVDVLKGEPKTEEHLSRHPFGKVPVVDVDGFRVIETQAIARYLNSVLPGRSLVPLEAKDAARMDMATNIIDSYGYGPMIGGVVAYHLFPDFVGGKNEAAHQEGLAKSLMVMTELMRLKGSSPFIAGDEVSLADLYLAPIVNYIAITPHLEAFTDLPGVGSWWDRASTLDSFRATQS